MKTPHSADTERGKKGVRYTMTVSLPTRKSTAQNQRLEAVLLRPADAADYLAISERKLWELQNCGQIPVVRLGRSVRYHRSDLEAFAQKLRRHQGSKQ